MKLCWDEFRAAKIPAALERSWRGWNVDADADDEGR
jgi:hypothetical protein